MYPKHIVDGRAESKILVNRLQLFNIIGQMVDEIERHELSKLLLLEWLIIKEINYDVK